jgi:hypothetical protein
MARWSKKIPSRPPPLSPVPQMGIRVLQFKHYSRTSGFRKANVSENRRLLPCRAAGGFDPPAHPSALGSFILRLGSKPNRRMVAASRKQRSFAHGLANESTRPFAVLPDQRGTRRERQKAVVDATRRLRHSLTSAPWLRQIRWQGVGSSAMDHLPARRARHAIVSNLQIWAWKDLRKRSDASR